MKMLPPGLNRQFCALVLTSLIALPGWASQTRGAGIAHSSVAQLTQQQMINLKHEVAGKHALQNNDLDTALNEFRVYNKIEPYDYEGNFYYAYCLSESGDKVQALRLYQAAEQQEAMFNYDSAELRINCGNLLMQQGLLIDAETEYRRALEIDPLAGEARLGLAQLLLLAGRTDAACVELNQCSATRGNDPRYCLLQGIAGLKNGQIESAVAWLRKCQVTSNQSPFVSRSDRQRGLAAEKLLELLKFPG